MSHSWTSALVLLQTFNVEICKSNSSPSCCPLAWVHLNSVLAAVPRKTGTCLPAFTTSTAAPSESSMSMFLHACGLLADTVDALHRSLKRPRRPRRVAKQMHDSSNCSKAWRPRVHGVQSKAFKCMRLPETDVRHPADTLTPRTQTHAEQPALRALGEQQLNCLSRPPGCVREAPSQCALFCPVAGHVSSSAIHGAWPVNTLNRALASLTCVPPGGVDGRDGCGAQRGALPAARHDAARLRGGPDEAGRLGSRLVGRTPPRCQGNAR